MFRPLLIAAAALPLTVLSGQAPHAQSMTNASPAIVNQSSSQTTP